MELQYPHPQLYEIVNAGRRRYIGHLTSFLRFAESFVKIPAQKSHDASQPNWANEWGTTRGTDTTTVPAVVLPRRVVTAHVILPNFSPGGNYVVSVTTDRDGTSEKASGRAVANVQGFHADLAVTLDLRVLPPSTYLLATTHEGDPASYFYPLTVR